MSIHFASTPDACSILVLDERLRCFEIGFDHFLNERVEVDLAPPSKELLRLRRVAEQEAVGRGQVPHMAIRIDIRTPLPRDGNTANPP